MKPIKDLKYSYIDIKPVNYDWTVGYPETWDYFAASECEKCGAVLVGRGDEKHGDIDDESECEGYVPLNEGPMMSFYYPLPEWERYGMDSNEAAKLLKNLPLCLVHFVEDDAYGLALTGGGMDLSWEICEAFMVLGYLPPFHFSDLPGMAGRGESKKDKWIIKGCIASADGIQSRAARVIERLKEQQKAVTPK